MRHILITVSLLFAINIQAQQRGGDGEGPVLKKVNTGKTYAVIVGVSSYLFIKPLDYAAADAVLFKKFLQSNAGGNVPDENIKMVLDAQARASTEASIRKWLLYDKKPVAGDKVFLYFAGHGDAVNKKEYFFLLSDINPQGEKQNYISNASTVDMLHIKSFIDEYLTSNGIQVFLIWDACRSNELPGGSEGKRISQLGIAESTSGENIMLSASAGESAWENIKYARGHGLFTYYLIDGLSGEADKPENSGNNDGIVDINELESWVKQQVRKESISSFKTFQNPKFVITSNVPVAVVDPKFREFWAAQKAGASDEVMARAVKTEARSANTSMDSNITHLYNQVMQLVSIDSVSGNGGAEQVVAELEKKYPENELTKDARFNLAMEYINLAQDKLTITLSGQDPKLLFARAFSKPSDETVARINKAALRSDETDGAYLEKAVAILRKDGGQDEEYLNQLTARKYFFLARALGHSNDLGQARDIKKALGYAKESLRLSPKAPYTYNLITNLYKNNEQFDSARISVNTAIQIAPKWAYPYYTKASLLKRMNMYDSAVVFFKKALEINPELGVAYDAIGLTYELIGNDDSTHLYFQKAVQANPSANLFTLHLGEYYLKHNNADSAIYYFKMGRIFKTENTPLIYNGLILASIDLGQYDSTLSFFKKAQKEYPGYPEKVGNRDGGAEINYLIAAAYAARNKNDEALVFVKKLLGIDPEYADEIEGEAIFKNLRKTPAYIQLIKKYKK